MSARNPVLSAGKMYSNTSIRYADGDVVSLKGSGRRTTVAGVADKIITVVFVQIEVRMRRESSA